MKIGLFLTLLISNIALAQSDSIFLYKKNESDPEAKWITLQKKEKISDFDIFLLKTYVSKLKSKGKDISHYNFAQLLDSLKVLKKSMKNGVVKIDNIKKDSIFIRDPYNEKRFIGMADMNLERLVFRESKNLPFDYVGELNIYFSSPQKVSKTLKTLNLNSEESIIFGNVFLIEIERGKEITDIKIGDILEITKRILKSKEFKSIQKLIPK